MAPFKKKRVLFLGRLDTDTCFETCLRYVKKIKADLIIAGDGPLRKLVPDNAIFLGWIKNVQKAIKESDIVFTTGYLGMLKTYIQRKPILIGWTNPVKEDSLKMHPMYEKNTDECFRWAKKQTWQKLADMYEKLWQK